MPNIQEADFKNPQQVYVRAEASKKKKKISKRVKGRSSKPG